MALWFGNRFTFLLAGQMCVSMVKDEAQLDLMNDMTYIE
jgi:hypothetical protein